MEEEPRDSAGGNLKSTKVRRRFPEPSRHRRFSVGVPGKWSACGWIVVQLDHDAEPGVQRTIKRADLTAYLSLQESYRSTMVHVGKKGIS